jgi:hypothetical protein
VDALSKLFAGLFGPPEAEDAFAAYLRKGNAVSLREVKVVLDERGVPFKWSRYECLHCEELSVRHQEGQYILSGRGRFEMDNWSCTSQGDSEQKADRPCRIELVFEWPDKEVRDGSEGVSMIPGRVRSLMHFLRQAWQRSQDAEPGAAADRRGM